MDSHLLHEDLLIKLRAKLNEEKIKLWESPYINDDENKLSSSLQELATKFSNTLKIDYTTILDGLRELQVHSIDRVKAIEEFKETGCATFRVKASLTGQKPKQLNITKKLTVPGDELVQAVSESLGVDQTRIKLIHNGKIVKPNSSLEEQGLKNGVQIMALVMDETPDQVKNEDKRYMEMKATLDDAMLLSEHVDDDDDDSEDEYMKLEDQSGKAVVLPAAERRALMVGLALHERGRAAAAARDYALALVLFLEADRQFSECRSSLLSSVDNWAQLQLDVAWCYLRLRLPAAPDAAARLARAAAAFRASYGEQLQRVIALKGNAANERVMFARLYLLQGIVAYHQDKRAEAAQLLDKAERELDNLRVDEESVKTLMELGWSAAQARWGLRAGGGCERAHACLLDMRDRRQAARDRHRQEREQRLLGVCADGSAVSGSALQDLLGMGFRRPLALAALKNANNNVTDAVRLIHDHPEMLDSDASDTPSSDEPVGPAEPAEPDNKLLAELIGMGYGQEAAADALRHAHNDVGAALDLLLSGACDLSHPSTSDGSARKKQKTEKKKKRKERELALRRLKKAIAADEDDCLGASLSEEEQELRRYRALL